MNIIPTASFLIGYTLLLLGIYSGVSVGFGLLADKIGFGLAMVFFCTAIAFISSRAKDTDGMSDSEDHL